MTAKKKAGKKKAARKGGRPRKIENPEKFNQLVDLYLEVCREGERHVTWTGMALALGFTSRQAIDEYAKYDGFSDSVKRAKLIVENAYESRLAGNSPTGAIFALKNMGWSDKSEHEITGKDGGPIQTSVDTSKLSTGALKELLAARASAEADQ